MTRSTLGATVAATALLMTSLVVGNVPLIYWNVSESVQSGIYSYMPGPPRRDDVAVVKLPSDLAAFAARRGYLPLDALLIKPVRATAGDVVCRFEDRVYVGGKLLIRALRADRLGRSLPRWHGCRTLNSNEILVMSVHPSGFDGRYFGPIPLRNVIGRARLLWPLEVQRKRATMEP